MEVGSGEEFYCDMYWPLLHMYWESSGFRLGGFCIKGGFSIRGKGLDLK